MMVVFKLGNEELALEQLGATVPLKGSTTYLSQFDVFCYTSQSLE